MTLKSGAWVTPAGHQVTMEYRDDTTDWNTIAAILTSDEYGLPHDQVGVFLDVGAHIGAWSIGAAIDNPGSTVVAIEALPENAELVQRNSDLNHAGVIVLNNAAGTNGRVLYGTSDTEFERQHRFIGGADWHGATSAAIELPTLSLSAIVKKYGPVRLLKIDCEGCEWSFLDDPAISDVAEVVGEYHPREGNLPARLRELLEPTHVVTLDDAEPFGAFRAVRR